MAMTSILVSSPPALFTSATQPFPDGNESLTPASGLPELTKAPPPYGTVPLGHSTDPRVCSWSVALTVPEITEKTPLVRGASALGAGWAAWSGGDGEATGAALAGYPTASAPAPPSTMAGSRLGDV